MAPFKFQKIKTYQNRTFARSNSVFNDLLVKNLTKRLESSSITSPEKSSETESTFDKLLKGQVYNQVEFKNFPENNIRENIGESSCSQSFLRNNSSNFDTTSLNESNSVESVAIKHCSSDDSVSIASKSNISALNDASNSLSCGRISRKNTSAYSKPNETNQLGNKFKLYMKNKCRSASVDRSPIFTRSKLKSRGHNNVSQNIDRIDGGTKNSFMSSLQLKESMDCDHSSVMSKNYVKMDNFYTLHKRNMASSRYDNDSQLCTSEYCKFEKFVDKISTPVIINDGKMKKQRRKYKTVPRKGENDSIEFPITSKKSNVQNCTSCAENNISLSKTSLEIIENLSHLQRKDSLLDKSNIQSNCDAERSSYLQVDTIESEALKKAKKGSATSKNIGNNLRDIQNQNTPSFLSLSEAGHIEKGKYLVASTPIRIGKISNFMQQNFISSLAGKENSSFMNDLYKTIYLSNYLCKNSNNLIIRKHLSMSKNSRLRKPKFKKRSSRINGDRKLKEQLAIVITRIPQLDKIARNKTRNSPINLNTLNLTVKESSLKFVTKRKNKRRKNEVQQDILSKSPIVLLTPLRLSVMALKNDEVRNGLISTKLNNNLNHVCSKHCRCLLRSPRVLLTRIDGLIGGGLLQKPEQPDTIIDLTESASEDEFNEFNISVSSSSGIEASIFSWKKQLNNVKPCYVPLKRIEEENVLKDKKTRDSYSHSLNCNKTNVLSELENMTNCSVVIDKDDVENALRGKHSHEITPVEDSSYTHSFDCNKTNYMSELENTTNCSVMIDKDEVENVLRGKDSHEITPVKKSLVSNGKGFGGFRHSSHRKAHQSSVLENEEVTDENSCISDRDTSSEVDIVESSIVDELLPQMKKRFHGFAAGKKFRRSIAIFKHAKDSLNVSESLTTPYCEKAARRTSIKVVAVSPIKKQLTELESYAARSSAGYTPTREAHLEELENHFKNLFVSINDSHTTAPVEQSVVHYTARDIVLRRCGQTEPLSFEKCYPPSSLQHCQKIGEGVFGEVFMYRNKDGSTTVMKIIPIEGNQIVNLEKQKTFEEILSEIIISMELSNLKQGKRNNTNAFTDVKKIRCVQGLYPDRLLELWELYDENKHSENDSPQIFHEDQLFIVLELANGGGDLEAFQFKNAQQSLAVFRQIVCALAVAENQLQFEHRDLHWGNVLISLSNEKNSTFILDGKEIVVDNKEAKATIIDFTLSRIENDGVVIFNDLALDEELFSAKGDYQFEIYRLMQKNNGNDWQSFKPYSNILWLHYILDKAITAFHYKNTKSKLHRSSLALFRDYENKILDYQSATDFALDNLV